MHFGKVLRLRAREKLVSVLRPFLLCVSWTSDCAALPLSIRITSLGKLRLFPTCYVPKFVHCCVLRNVFRTSRVVVRIFENIYVGLLDPEIWSGLHNFMNIQTGLPAYLLGCFLDILDFTSTVYHFVSSLCVLQIAALSLPIDIQHTPCPCCFVLINYLVFSTSCWNLRPKWSWFSVPCLWNCVVRYCTTGMIAFLRYCNTDSGSFQWDVGRILHGGSFSDSPETGEDSSRCSRWILLLSGRNKLSRKPALRSEETTWK